MTVELRFESHLDDHSRDAVAIRARLYIDDQPSSAVNVVIAGTDLLQVRLSSSELGERPDVLLHCAAPHVQLAFEDRRLPLPDRLGVIEIRIRAEDAARLLKPPAGPLTADLVRSSVDADWINRSAPRLERFVVSNLLGFCSPQDSKSRT